MQPGSLTIVGTGIQFAGQMTIEARAYIKQAEKVLFLVSDPITADWIKDINPSAESLYPCYQQGESRMIAYQGMIERILNEVRKGMRVCAVFYGHPGVFVYPSHEAIKQARLEGYSAKMLPGISAEDCLFADLGIESVPLAQLPDAQISPISTLYLAPQTQAPLDDEMLERLGFDLLLQN